MEQNEGFTTTELAVKCKSKPELYILHVREAKINLPSKQEAAESYLRDIMIGNKLYLSW